MQLPTSRARVVTPGDISWRPVALVPAPFADRHLGLFLGVHSLVREFVTNRHADKASGVHDIPTSFVGSAQRPPTLEPGSSPSTASARKPSLHPLVCGSEEARGPIDPRSTVFPPRVGVQGIIKSGCVELGPTSSAEILVGTIVQVTGTASIPEAAAGPRGHSVSASVSRASAWRTIVLAFSTVMRAEE